LLLFDNKKIDNNPKGLAAILTGKKQGVNRLFLGAILDKQGKSFRKSPKALSTLFGDFSVLLRCDY